MQIQPPHRFRLLAMAAFLSIFGSSVAGAQSYPARPIQVIVPFAGGSASDVVTRILLDRTSKAYVASQRRLRDSDQSVVARTRRLVEQGAKGKKLLREELQPTTPSTALPLLLEDNPVAEEPKLL